MNRNGVGAESPLTEDNTGVEGEEQPCGLACTHTDCLHIHTRIHTLHTLDTDTYCTHAYYTHTHTHTPTHTQTHTHTAGEQVL